MVDRNFSEQSVPENNVVQIFSAQLASTFRYSHSCCKCRNVINTALTCAAHIGEQRSQKLLFMFMDYAHS